MKKKLILGALALLILLPAKAQITWQQVEPGVWKGVVGTPESYSLLDVSGVTPLKEGFTRLPEVTLPALANEIVGAVQDGKTSLRIPLQRKEQLYGFGLNFQTVHQRGKILDLHVDHYGGKDNGRTHTTVICGPMSPLSPVVFLPNRCARLTDCGYNAPPRNFINNAISALSDWYAPLMPVQVLIRMSFTMTITAIRISLRR